MATQGHAAQDEFPPLDIHRDYPCSYYPYQGHGLIGHYEDFAVFDLMRDRDMVTEERQLAFEGYVSRGEKISHLKNQLYCVQRQLRERDLLIEQLRTRIAQLTTDPGRSDHRGVAMDEAGPSRTVRSPDRGIEVINNIVGNVVRVEENMLGENEHREGIGKDNVLVVEGEQGVQAEVPRAEQEVPVEEPVNIFEEIPILMPMEELTGVPEEDPEEEPEEDPNEEPEEEQAEDNGNNNDVEMDQVVMALVDEEIQADEVDIAQFIMDLPVVELLDFVGDDWEPEEEEDEAPNIVWDQEQMDDGDEIQEEEDEEVEDDEGEDDDEDGDAGSVITEDID